VRDLDTAPQQAASSLVHASLQCLASSSPQPFFSSRRVKCLKKIPSYFKLQWILTSRSSRYCGAIPKEASLCLPPQVQNNLPCKQDTAWE